jgi:hypothetical protein
LNHAHPSVPFVHRKNAAVKRFISASASSPSASRPPAGTMTTVSR